MNSINPNRYRVSSNFLLPKIFFAFLMLVALIQVIMKIGESSLTPELFIELIFVIGIFASLLYYVFTRKRIDYDDILHILYVVYMKKETEEEIPVEKIDKILYSFIGSKMSGSYIIVYRDFQNQKKKIRLHPIPFEKHIGTIKTDARLKNPNLVTRDFSFGWNELFD